MVLKRILQSKHLCPCEIKTMTSTLIFEQCCRGFFRLGSIPMTAKLFAVQIQTLKSIMMQSTNVVRLKRRTLFISLALYIIYNQIIS